jgi:hypothetical protein
MTFDMLAANAHLAELRLQAEQARLAKQLPRKRAQRRDAKHG